jgi:pyridoxine/pyridoxamine 5'-phosphate oxidase
MYGEKTERIGTAADAIDMLLTLLKAERESAAYLDAETKAAVLRAYASLTSTISKDIEALAQDLKTNQEREADADDEPGPSHGRN